MSKRDTHRLKVKYPDNTQSTDMILAVTKDGITVSVDGVMVTHTPNWLDEHRCWINNSRRRLPRPYSKHYRGLVNRLASSKKGLRERQFSTGRQETYQS